MKRYVLLLFVILFCMSACTLTLPDLMDVRIINVEFEDSGNLSVFLRNAEDGFFVQVGGQTYDCVMLEDPSGVLKCTGPGFAPGEEQVLKFFAKESDTEPVAELVFEVPEYPDALKDLADTDDAVDTDNDGVPDTEDKCPADPAKNAPGVCGCGVNETDSDADGTPDCMDKCPANPEKVSPDANGCDVGEKDSDQDGIPDSSEMCPDDPEKTEPGECGCGVSDIDTDNDGLPDCTDECPESFSDPVGDPCDHDEDNDGVHDFADECPLNPNKTELGVCGCDLVETDRDKDGTPDCVDKCPDDPKKIKPGQCGCGVKDKDSDDDGVADCKDACPLDKNDPVGDPCDHDEDCDGYDDWIDECPYDPLKKHLPCS